MTDTLTSKELLPCAHCGGAAQLTEVEPMHYVVECSEPMCNMSTRVYISAMDDSRPLAIEAWNRRVAVEPPAVDVAPIAKLTVRDGLVQRAGLYAPGLPDGDHDVFPVPLSPKGELRPHVLAEPPSGWRPIETAPKDREVLFWVVPLSAEETYRDTSGNPITSGEKPRMMFCRFGRWSSLSKAIYWADVPGSPT